MISLFEQFLRERRFVKNSSQNTLLFYEQSFKAFNLHEPLTKGQLTERITVMREKGMKPSTVNCYIRGINSFLSWLHENQHISEPLKIKQLKCEQKMMSYFSDDQLKAIITYKPKDEWQVRLHTLILLCLDTGIRIDEALTLKRGGVDFENLLITVTGKGNKERIVPISIECRKVLFKLLKSHKFELVFCTRYGGQLLYDNMRREFKKLLERLDIKVDGSFHALRRTFARNFVRSGGNLFYLQKFLGHTTLIMSRRYVELETEDLQKAHSSILSKIR
jgi:integrase/recombinase XerD